MQSGVSRYSMTKSCHMFADTHEHVTYGNRFTGHDSIDQALMIRWIMGTTEKGTVLELSVCVVNLFLVSVITPQLLTDSSSQDRRFVPRVGTDI